MPPSATPLTTWPRRRDSCSSRCCRAIPPARLLHIIDQLARSPPPDSRDGVWVSADGARALVVAQTRPADPTPMRKHGHRCHPRRVRGALPRCRAVAAPRTCNCSLSGPGVFAVGGARQDRTRRRAAVDRQRHPGRDAVAAVYRSLPALGLGLAAGRERRVDRHRRGSVGIWRRTWHHLGIRHHLIGESVDYSIYFFVQSRRRRAAPGASWQQPGGPRSALGC